MTIVNDDSSVISKWSCKLIDNARVVIYYCNMFIIQATGLTSTSRPGDKLYSIAAIGTTSLLGKILPCWHVFDGKFF